MDVLVVSGGDPAGIGPEIALKAWNLRATRQIPPFVLIADPDVIRARAHFLQIDVKVEAVLTDNPVKNFQEALPVIPLKNRQSDQLGLPSHENAAGIIEAIKRGVQLIQSGHACALVTCPIAKKSLYDAGFEFPGHTELLADLAHQASDKYYHPVMMLSGPRLKTVPITVHIPFKKVPSHLTHHLIVQTALITEKDLRTRFKIISPRLAVAGLNPHAGEEGAIGKEDIEIIIPAIETLKNKGLNIVGPLPADTMFHECARKAYDVALCMYHDQALIPVKTLDFDTTVNITLGLPFIRTSPDHGTAFDIAAKGIASPESFISALKLAHQLAENSFTPCQ
ncbi:4-hydroxythreonine-4-phosphate dehydrogenase [Bartonella henselae]|uniref:4-hydroxythreonine-4-phosphate dehydrogenase n=1 Tax=Bartonella henselae (strain ATCC 49882 / DSM 28221 / CCUG 30454 / Houston 1) TaxID=283166 RepID=A0A0H3LXX1_BARHE|nr:4-hydroxythreonine-4-phosphate dehydrogenase PdxA [Bartonella henselae]ATP12147.1 4-hydroxythreonine-4-phosphate dehydrogenase [Bartonella henselae]ETS09899.1 4-hydroxythreonine-4-phosphate dehydrogenase [Bartonella henselae JK 50]ETS10409.1 4-hydroxythreonine-4-phosphate dehydrogenase [Bartonella henselae JK 51]MDM9990175.1 4-hydroxythreonine-4-phosphate dehydrogenase PdxA [Bartonella henselae]OLL39797.1 4-hydroxythreonine-4-phosphate dehydrogenase [Bartonella henselae]